LACFKIHRDPSSTYPPPTEASSPPHTRGSTFPAEDGAKVYLIKKYFDADIQKDIWDILVIKIGLVIVQYARQTRER
jgi:hypothetical protein